MSSWQSFVDSLMADGSCQDAAIIGYAEPAQKYAWAFHPGGTFANMTSEEIDVLVGRDREMFLTNGLVLCNRKCSVIRDSLQVDDDWTMDIRTKNENGEPTYNISIGRAEKVLVVVMGGEGVHGGALNKKTFEMIDELRRAGY